MAFRGNRGSPLDKQVLRYVPGTARITPRQLYRFQALCRLAGRQFKLGTEVPYFTFSNARRRLVVSRVRFFRSAALAYRAIDESFMQALRWRGALRHS